MDDVVLRAMAKWPNVPSVFGWLALDRRGHWRLRRERIGNRATNDFISRNYTCDEQGRWYFQNGPQRVFVTLDYTPWVFTLDAGAQLRTHTQLPVETLHHCWIDDGMNLLLETEHGVGIVHDHDLEPLTEAFHSPDGRKLLDDETASTLDKLTSGVVVDVRLHWNGHSLPVSFIGGHRVAAHFNFVPEPELANGQ